MMFKTNLVLLHTSNRLLSATNSPLFKLRQKTGLAYNLCREALNKYPSDLDQAEIWLKGQALARGLQKATKVSGRSTREGLISIAVHRTNKIVTVFELNCETDFVSRNQTFKDFVIDINEQILASSDAVIESKTVEASSIGLFELTEARLNEIEKQIAPLVVKLGENIRVGRAHHLKVLDGDNTKIFGQIHARAAQKNNEDFDVHVGRFGATVALNHPSSIDLQSLKSFGNRLCQHVIGFNPNYIELPENIRKQLEKAEQEQLERRSAEKDEEAEYSDQEFSQVSHSNRDDWPSIMDQTLIMSNDLSVREFCKTNGLSIVQFNRYECGVDG